MNKRDHKSRPAPRTSPATDHRRPVIAHNNETSVGTTPGGMRKAILDKFNGRGMDGGAPVTTDEGFFDPSSW